MRRIIKPAIVSGLLAGAILPSAHVAAQVASPEPTSTAGPLGLTQDAWSSHLRNRGESKSRPGYVRYVFNPQQAFPIRTREGMVTTIKLPEGEEITSAFAGDEAGFQVGIPTPQTIVIKAIFPGVDTNLIAYASSGQIYTFYLRSDGYEAREISDFLVEVVAENSPKAYTGAQMDVMSPEQLAQYDARNPASAAARIRDPYATLPANLNPIYAEYAEWTDFDPSTLKEDLGVYVPIGHAGGTIPYRVFRDNRFTYVDYGPNAAQITEWPTPLIVIQGVEGPVGNRTAGPGGRMIVIEALGDFVLRNGERIIVVKPKATRVDPKLVEYPTYDQTPMRIPTDIPPGRAAPVPTAPKTVVPLVSEQATPSQEHPSAVVDIASARENPADLGMQKVTSVVTSAVVQETPVAKGAGSPIVTAVATSTTATSASAAASASALRPVDPDAMIDSASSAALDQARPSATGAYYVSLGTAARTELEDRWKSVKVQHYEHLQGIDPVFYDLGGGLHEMRLGSFVSPTGGISLCESLTDQPTCSVKTSR